MKNEEVKKPTPKAAPPKKETPKTGKQPGKGSSAVAPNINEDDLGVGMSKEEADAKMSECFPSDVLSKCEEAKW